jgi:hypothetical protein
MNMFGLMRVSKHKAEIADIGKKLETEEVLSNTLHKRNNRLQIRVAELEIDIAGERERLRHAEAELKRRDGDKLVAMQATFKKPARKLAAKKAVK